MQKLIFLIGLACLFLNACSLAGSSPEKRAAAGVRSEMKDPPGCFNPLTDPVLNSFLVPNKIVIGDGANGERKYSGALPFHETPQTIEEIHRVIFDAYDKNPSLAIDPRLVYYRMLGESSANPYAIYASPYNLNPWGGSSGRAYGLYQFLGSSCRHPKVSHRDLILQRMQKNPNESPRLLQTRYYLSEYVQCFAEKARGCAGLAANSFGAYPPFYQTAYLGWGNCSQGAVLKEIRTCGPGGNANYRRGACKMIAGLVSMDHRLNFRAASPQPFCPSYVEKMRGR